MAVRPILIVHGDPAEQERLSRTLSGDFDVVCVADAERALEMARAEPPLAVVVDFPIPLRDGTTLASALRASPVTAAVPVIAYSGWDFPRTRRKALELGCCSFVSQRSEPRALRDALLLAIGEGAATAA